MTIDYLLAYLRMASYSIVFICSLFSLKYGIKSIKRLLYANIIFSFCTLLSVSGFALNILDLQISVNWFVTIGAIIWGIVTFSNTIIYSKL